MNSHFEQRIWICVSEDFDLRRIIKAIIESIAPGQAIRENSELDLLQKNLRQKLFGKRYLLVLDDVWNEDIDKWDKLKASLECGSRGAFVLTTTRSDRVARIMGTLQSHYLSVMSEADCWSLFKNYAFRQLDGEHLNLVKIGERIVKKCGGLPLAAKTLGSLLSFTSDENKWTDVLESEIWGLPQHENSILHALRLSYFHLPFSARQCFGYCAVFLKDTRISKEKLINMWMASGLLSSGGSSRMENTGEAIWNELYQRSFFQNVKKDSYFENIETTFEMHDLMHDLAHSVIEEEHLTLHLKRMTRTVPRKDVRHITAVGQDPFDRDLVPEMMYEFQSLRTLIFLQVGLEKIFIKIDFTKFGLLRVLDAQDCCIVNVPSSIGSLKHLRYLNLSCNSSLEGLPKSICNLCNLQTLDLCYCYSLKELPKHMRRLRNLRHLFLQGCREITKMPLRIGDLTDLQTLSFFIVGEREEDHNNLSELQGLDLRGSLKLKHLERVGNPKDAEIANLVAKQNIRCLKLMWIDTDVQPPAVAAQVLEALQPHSNLEALKIEGYKGTHLPHWMEDLSVLANVEFLYFEGCRNCRLPMGLGQLPRLRKLIVYGMEFVEYCDKDLADVSSSGIVRRFPSLEYMHIEDMPNLIRLSRSEESSYGSECLKLTNLPTSLPSLQILNIYECPELTNLPTSLPSLQNLHIMECPKLTNLPTSLPSLQYLTITGCPELTNLPTSIASLQQLEIIECPKLTNLPTSLPSLQYLRIRGGCLELTNLPTSPPSLPDLNISRCQELTNLPTSLPSLQDLPTSIFSLQNLSIYECPELTNLPTSLPSLQDLPTSIPSLQSLSIYECPELTNLPTSLPSLQNLHIMGCPKLTKLPTSLPSLQQLDMKIYCNSVLNCISNFQSLTRLSIEVEGGNVDDVTSFSEGLFGNLAALVYLRLEGFAKLKEFTADLSNLTALEKLEILYFKELESLPQSLQHARALQSLAIWSCSELPSLPDWLGNLRNLQTLKINDCPQLKSRCEKEKGEDWPKIKHIRAVYIDHKLQ